MKPEENQGRRIFSSVAESRRRFIGRTAVTLCVAAVPWPRRSEAAASTDAPKKTLVGSNVYGWGQYAERDHKSLNIPEVLSALRDTGYDYLETFLDLARPDENGRFAEQLHAKGLQPVSLYTGARLHEPARAKESVEKILAAAKICQQAGFKVLSCNADPIGREKTE